MLSHHLVVIMSSTGPASTIRLVLAWRHAPAVALQHASSKAGLPRLCLDDPRQKVPLPSRHFSQKLVAQ